MAPLEPSRGRHACANARTPLYQARDISVSPSPTCTAPALFDARIRAHLREEGYEATAIAASELSDRGAMARHLSRVARMLDGEQRAREIRDDTEWFQGE